MDFHFVQTFSWVVLLLICANNVLAQKQDVGIGDIKFYLYSVNDNTRGVEIPFEEVATSPLQNGVRTFLVIDGFLRNCTGAMSQTVKDDYLRVVSLFCPGLLRMVPNTNVIVVDWGKFSGSLSGLDFTGNLIDMVRLFALYDDVARDSIQPVGKLIAAFLTELKVHKNIQFSQVHVLGFSMGATIGGAIGHELIRKHGEKLGRVSALDPAGPYFQGEKDFRKKIDKDDATFVDVYHSNRYGLGDGTKEMGHVNFFLNGGKGSHPGCENEQFFDGALCSHWYAWRLWNLSMERVINACSCSGVTNCECRTCSHSCSNPIRVGLETPTNVTGNYYVGTRQYYHTVAATVKPASIRPVQSLVSRFTSTTKKG